MAASPPSERADAKANRERLLAAAHAVFAERGTDAEMKEIAERAGIGVGTIYRNFATKDDLVTALVADAMGEIEAHIDGCIGREDPLESLEAFMTGIFEMVDQYGHLMDFVMGDPDELIGPETKARFHAKGEVILARCAEAGVVRRDVPPATLVTVLHGFAHIYKELAETGPRDGARRACRELFLTGCGARTQVSRA